MAAPLHSCACDHSSLTANHSLIQQVLARCYSVAHYIQVRIPEHLHHRYILEVLEIVSNRHGSIQAKYPDGVVLFCGWFKVYGSSASINSDCLRRPPRAKWHMHPAAASQLSMLVL